jgi:hypothetical protein
MKERVAGPSISRPFLRRLDIPDEPQEEEQW